MAEEVKASATATIVQAAEHFIIDEAKTIASKVSTKNAAEIKNIVNGVAKETVAASDDSIGTIIQNIEDGAEAIGSEIVKGAVAVVDAVERHPELIAEGALAIGIGVASLVQPELIVGSVALIGKMAADAAKETVSEIVVESSTAVVKGVASEVAEETAQLAAQDAAEKAKYAALENVKGGLKSSVEATVDVKSVGNVTTEIVPSEAEGKVTGTNVLTTVSGEAKAVVREVVPDSKNGPVQGPIISEETVHTSAMATSRVQEGSKTVTKEGPAVVVTSNDLTGDIKAVVQKGSTIAVADNSSSEQKQISLGTVDIKVLAKEVAREMSELDAKHLAEEGVVGTDKVLGDPVPQTKPKELSTKLEVTSVASTSVQKPEADTTTNKVEAENKSFIDNCEPKPSEMNGTKDVGRVASSTLLEKKPVMLENVIEDAGEVNKKPNKPAFPSKGIDHSSKNPSLEFVKDEATISEQSTGEVISEVKEDSGVAYREPSIQLLSNTEDSPVRARDKNTLAETTGLSAGIEDLSVIAQSPHTPEATPISHVTIEHHAATHAAVLEAHEKIAVLHSSNKLLHQKLDAMQAALQAITNALAERVPSATIAQEHILEQPNAELVATEHNQIILASAAAKPTEIINKRMSVFGTIGWLFGTGAGVKKHKRGQSIATSTPASIPATSGT